MKQERKRQRKHHEKDRDNRKKDAIQRISLERQNEAMCVQMFDIKSVCGSYKMWKKEKANI